MSNKTYHQITVTQIKGLVPKTIGLLGSKKPKCILFRTRFGIHTFGLGYPIDVLILNKAYQIMRVKEHMLPNTFFIWNPLYSIVIELPDATIRKRNIHMSEYVNILTQ